MNPTFLLDENVRGLVSNAILAHNRRGRNPIDFLRVGDFPELPLGVLDPEILDWAGRNGRILVTRDHTTMPTFFLDHLASGRRSAGVLIVRKGTRVADVVEHLAAIAWASEAWEYVDRFGYIP